MSSMITQTIQVARMLVITLLVISSFGSNAFATDSCDETATDGTAESEAVVDVRVRIEVTIPDEASSVIVPDEALYIAGDSQQLGAWRPDGLRLQRFAGNVYWAEFSVPVGSRLKFKVTRGSWLTVEKDKFGNDIPNRELVATASDEDVPQKFSIVVQQWGVAKSVQSTVTGSLKLHEHVGSKHLSRVRNVSVWLPPGYEESDQEYPVLYLQDGQNLFDASTAAFGEEWRVDETAQELIKKKEIPPLIMVGIWNTADRIDEYTLTKDERLERGGRGLDYIRFIADELKPLIDDNYRTHGSRESTMIGGSSLGGLIALHACLQRPEVFGCCIAFSPTLRWDQESLLQSLHGGAKWPANTRLWFSMGTREGRDAELQKLNLARAQQLHQLLGHNNNSKLPQQIEFQEFADATHDEKSWAAQFSVALKSMLAR